MKRDEDRISGWLWGLYCPGKQTVPNAGFEMLEDVFNVAKRTIICNDFFDNEIRVDVLSSLRSLSLSFSLPPFLYLAHSRPFDVSLITYICIFHCMKLIHIAWYELYQWWFMEGPATYRRERYAYRIPSLATEALFSLTPKHLVF